MIQGRNRTGFALEPVGELRFRNLHRYDAVQACVARLPHFTHPAFTNRGEKFVWAENFACREWHSLRHLIVIGGLPTQPALWLKQSLIDAIC